MEKRLIVAVTLSISVMLIYAFLVDRLYPQKRTFKAPTLETKTQIPEEIQTKKSPLVIEAKKELLENNRLKVSINSIGGSIEEIVLKDKGTEGGYLVKDSVLEEGIFSLESNLIREGSHLDFGIKKIDEKVILMKEFEALKIEKSLSLLDERFGILAEIKFKNLKAEPLNLSYKINLGIQSLEDPSHRGFLEVAIANQEKVSRISAYKIRNYRELQQKDLELLALKGRFYSLITRPQDVPVFGLEISKKNSKVTVFLKTQDFKIMPGDEVTHRYIFYAGPNRLNELKEFGYNFERVLSFGLFNSIAQILLTILNLFYKMSKNYGISIILLSLLVNLFLFPLTLKSFISMRQLQGIQPEINKIREEFKENPQGLNKELMELYKRHKVNPFGGCLPMLLQMPIFFALFQAFMHSTELKDQAFLWIKDLSGPDALYRLNFKLPILGDALNLLPLLMVFAMFIQQRLTTQGIPSEQTEQQKILSFIMPIMFGIIFYNMPAGLVLYWFTSTLLSSTVQFVLIRKKA